MILIKRGKLLPWDRENCSPTKIQSDPRRYSEVVHNEDYFCVKMGSSPEERGQVEGTWEQSA
jgi:hypothetical protein